MEFFSDCTTIFSNIDKLPISLLKVHIELFPSFVNPVEYSSMVAKAIRNENMKEMGNESDMEESCSSIMSEMTQDCEYFCDDDDSDKKKCAEDGDKSKTDNESKTTDKNKTTDDKEMTG